jgi:hypothetical protein
MGRTEMGSFAYRLELEDGTLADPAYAVHGGTNLAPRRHPIPLGKRILRVIAVRDDDADQAPLLVVKDMSGPGTSEEAA